MHTSKVRPYSVTSFFRHERLPSPTNMLMIQATCTECETVFEADISCLLQKEKDHADICGDSMNVRQAS